MGEGKIAHRSSSSTVRGRNPARRWCFFLRGGATVAGGGPATVWREGKVSSTLHGRETMRGRLGRRSPWMKLATAEDGRTSTRFGHGGGAASDSGDGAVGTGRGEVRRLGQRRRRGRNDAALSGRRRMVPIAHLMRGHGTAHGSHAATARCQAGPARTAASDRWDPLVSVF
jgi:hypothetical protein